MEHMTEATFQKRYFSIREEDCGYPICEEDHQYTWTYFRAILPFWQRAAAVKKYVLFTADQ